MTSLIAACGFGRSTNFIPAVPAAWSVTTIAFIGIVSAVICLSGGKSRWTESPQGICQRPLVAFVDDFSCRAADRIGADGAVLRARHVAGGAFRLGLQFGPLTARGMYRVLRSGRHGDRRPYCQSRGV